MIATLALAGRSLRRFRRSPAQIVASIIFPGLLLVVLLACFGELVEEFTGADYVSRIVPGIVAMSLAYGAVASGVSMLEDLRDGFAGRLKVMPVATGALLAGRVTADAVRGAMSTTVLTVLGFAVGFRFETGVTGVIAFVLLAALATTGFSWLALSVGTRAPGIEAVAAPLNALFLVCLFLSEGFVPIEGYPGWAQPIVRANPFTCIRNALAAIAEGGSTRQPVLYALAWIAGLTLVFAPLAITGFRARSRTTGPGPAPTVAEARV